MSSGWSGVSAERLESEGSYWSMKRLLRAAPLASLSSGYSEIAGANCCWVKKLLIGISGGWAAPMSSLF